MLKRIVFKNLVHFEEKSVIDFENYPEKRSEKKKEDGNSKADVSNSSCSDNTYDAEAKAKESQKSNASDLETNDAEAKGKESTESNASDLNKIDDAKAKGKESNFNILVGANFCGKSTVMELIRRCLTDDINLTVTNSFDSSSIAYAFCEFKLESKPVIVGFIKRPKDHKPQAGNPVDAKTQSHPSQVLHNIPKDDKLEDNKKDGASKDENSQDNKPQYDKAQDGNPNGKETQQALPDGQHVLKDASSQDENQEDDESKDENSEVNKAQDDVPSVHDDVPQTVESPSENLKEDKPCDIFKILWYRDGSEIYIRWKKQGNKTEEKISKDPLNEKESGKEVFLSLFNKSQEIDNQSTIDDILSKIETSSTSKSPVSTDTPNWSSLEKAFVATFPLRGIGIVHWTKSPNIPDTNNYEKACERAEILSKLLKNKASIDEKKEKKIFDFITHPLVFDFEMKDKQIWVRHENEKKKPFPLLKTSEGIIEAKITCLLLAHEDFQTICLEDPDRGMHPQMIERLKTVLYICGFEKTIIVTTHSPYFVDTITIKKTHVFFKKKQTSGPYICSVRNAGKCDDLSYVDGIETLRSLLFATKVLLVEGSTDREVIQAIFTQEKSNKLNMACNGDLSEALDDFNKMDFTTYQIIPIGGCQNASKVKKACKFIHLPCLCLLDLDFYVKLKDYEKFSSEIKKDMRQTFDKKYKNNELSTFLKEDFKELSKTLEKENIFVWKGDLEHAILRCSKTLQNKIGKSLGLKFDNLNDDQKAYKLKEKLKSRLTYEERTAFSSLLMETKEIERFIDFLKSKEGNEMVEDNN